MNSSVILFNKLFVLIAIVIIEANSANCQSSDGLSFPGEADLVLSLPNVSLPVGQNYSSVRHYSGYLQTSAKFDSSNVPYWFFESQSENWQTQPVVLWLSGYVSALHQALTGISPIRMNVNGSLYLNEHSWNKNANLLILDQFPEVGIPSINWTLIMTNDTMAAEFALDALENFYGKFPDMFENPFYIAGEGLVSFHIGILAKLLVEKQFPPNFKGIIIGNGVYNMSNAVNAHFQYIYKEKKDLYENEFWENLKSLCCPQKTCSFWLKASDSCTFQHCQTFTKNDANQNLEPKSECKKLYKKFYDERKSNYTSFPLPLDLHNIQEKCLIDIENFTCKRYSITKKIFDWFNLDSKAVLDALHFEDFTINEAYWMPAEYSVQQYLLRQYPTLHGHLMFLLSKNIRVLLYTGELDGVVSPFNTKWLLNELPLKPMHHGVQDWVYDTKTVGHRTRFCGGLTFYSITGAGHTVAEDAPAVALEMLREFLYEEHSTNSVNHWLTDCLQTVPSCTFCSTDPEPGKEDEFSEFWIYSQYRYYANYKATM